MHGANVVFNAVENKFNFVELPKALNKSRSANQSLDLSANDKRTVIQRLTSKTRPSSPKVFEHLKQKVDFKAKNQAGGGGGRNPDCLDAAHTLTLPPLAPKAKARDDNEPSKPSKGHVTNLRVFHDNVILINPNIDSSDKELHQRNGFKSTGKHLVSFLKNHGRVFSMKNIKEPKMFG